jgi:hypothetical protein
MVGMTGELAFSCVGYTTGSRAQGDAKIAHRRIAAVAADPVLSPFIFESRIRNCWRPPVGDQ